MFLRPCSQRAITSPTTSAPTLLGSERLQDLTPLTKPTLFPPLLSQPPWLCLAQTSQPHLPHTHSCFWDSVTVLPAHNTLFFFNPNIMEIICILPISTKPHPTPGAASEPSFSLDNIILSSSRIQVALESSTPWLNTLVFSQKLNHKLEGQEPRGLSLLYTWHTEIVLTSTQ